MICPFECSKGVLASSLRHPTNPSYIQYYSRVQKTKLLIKERSLPLQSSKIPGTRPMVSEAPSLQDSSYLYRDDRRNDSQATQQMFHIVKLRTISTMIVVQDEHVWSYHKKFQPVLLLRYYCLRQVRAANKWATPSRFWENHVDWLNCYFAVWVLLKNRIAAAWKGVKDIVERYLSKYLG